MEEKKMTEKRMPLPGGNQYMSGSAAEDFDIKPVGWEVFEKRTREREAAIRKRQVEEDVEILLRQKYQAAKKYTFGQVLAVVAGVAVFISACVFYLSQESDLVHTENVVASLSSEYQVAMSDNNAKKSAIEASLDYNEIYRIATEDLEMQYPQKHQIVEFNQNQDGYVIQNEMIPQE